MNCVVCGKEFDNSACPRRTCCSLDCAEVFDDRITVEALKRDGISVFPHALSQSRVQDVWRHLETKKRWHRHVKQEGEEVRPDSATTCWSMEDVLRAPHLLELASEFAGIARGYLDAEPLVYSVNAFTTRAVPGPAQWDIGEYHRDPDDKRFLVLFVYLTDVTTMADGPHQFCVGSHNDRPVDDRCHGETVGDRQVETVYGPAGTAFLAATWGLHRGVKPVEQDRTVAWVRWGVSDPPAAYDWDKLQCHDIPGRCNGFSDEFRRSLRLVVR